MSQEEIPDQIEIASEASNYVLYQMQSQHLTLHVMTNQSAFYYFIEHILSPEEEARYHRLGHRYLKSLANRVRRLERL